MEDRKHFAAIAFNVSSHYDTAIFNYFNQDNRIKALNKASYSTKNFAMVKTPIRRVISLESWMKYSPNYMEKRYPTTTCLI